MSVKNWTLKHQLSFISHNNSIQGLLNVANEACEKKQFQKALDIYTQCLNLCSKKQQQQQHRVLSSGGGATSRTTTATSNDEYSNVNDDDSATILSYRSRVHLELGNFEQSLQDASDSLVVNKHLVLAYVCKAESLIALERMADALVVYSTGIAISLLNNNAKSVGDKDQLSEDDEMLLERLVSCCCDQLSPIKDVFSAVYEDLKRIGLCSKPVAVLTEIGQELLTLGYTSASVSVLENANKCGTKSLKLKSCILSALTNANWSMKNYEVALVLMDEDLSLAKQLNDPNEQTRCLGNLGAACFFLKRYGDALNFEEERFKVADEWCEMDNSEDAREIKAHALSQMAHCYRAMDDLQMALSSYKKSAVEYMKTGNRIALGQQFGNAGILYAMLGKVGDAVECHQKHLNISTELENEMEISRACYNLGLAKCQIQHFSDALIYFNKARHSGSNLKDVIIQAKAYYGMGTVHRLAGNWDTSIEAHQKQLAMAEGCWDSLLKIQALTSLGIVRYMKGEYDCAIDLFKQSLLCATENNCHVFQSRNCGYIASCYAELENYEESIKYFTMEIELSSEMNDKVSQCVAAGNLGLAYQCSKEYSNAETSLLKHVALANSMQSDTNSSTPTSTNTVRQLIINSHLNLGNFYAFTEQFSKALPYFKQILNIVQNEEAVPASSNGDGGNTLATNSTSTKDSPTKGPVDSIEARVLFVLGYIYFRLEDFKTSIQYYHDSLLATKELDEPQNLAQICFNLGLLHQIVGKFDISNKCYEKCYQICCAADDHRGLFRALGALGDVSVLMEDFVSAKRFYEQQLQVSLDFEEVDLEIEANCSLGFINLKMSVKDIALKNFSKMLTLCKESGSMVGQCQSTLYLGRVQMKMNNFHVAVQYYNECAEMAHQLNDMCLLLDVYNSKADCYRLDQQFKLAIEAYEIVLKILQNHNITSHSSVDEDQSKKYRQMENCSNLNIQGASHISRQISVMFNIAHCYRVIKDYASAIEVYQSLANLCLANDRWMNVASCLHELANVLVLNKEMSKAEAVFSDLITLCEDYNSNAAKIRAESHLNDKFLIDSSFYYTSLYDYASFLMDLSKFDEAVEFLKKSLQFTDNDLVKEHESSLALGICYDKGDIDSQLALSFYEMAIRMAASAKDKYRLATAQLFYGTFLFHCGDFIQSGKILEECLDVACDIDSVQDRYGAISKLSQVKFASKQYDEAILYFNEAIAHFDGLLQQNATNLSVDELIERLELILYSAKCLFCLRKNDECSERIEQLEIEILRSIETIPASKLVSIYVQTCKLNVSIRNAFGDTIKALNYCMVENMIENTTINCSLDEQISFLLNKIPLLLLHANKLVTKVLEDHLHLHMFVHCYDDVICVWLCNRRVNEFVTIPSQKLSQHLKEHDLSENCTDILKYICKCSNALIHSQKSSHRTNSFLQMLQGIFLPANFQFALQKYNADSKLVIYLNDVLFHVPFHMLRLANGTLLSDSLQISFMIKTFPDLADQLESSESYSDTPYSTCEQTEKMLTIFSNNLEPNHKSYLATLLETFQFYCGKNQVNLHRTNTVECKRVLLETLQTESSCQICCLSLELDDRCDQSENSKFITMASLNSNNAFYTHSSINGKNVQLRLSFEEIFRSRINKNKIIMLFFDSSLRSPSDSLDATHNFSRLYSQLYHTLCVLIISGAQCIFAPQFASSAFSNFAKSSVEKFCLRILSGECVMSALDNLSPQSYWCSNKLQLESSTDLNRNAKMHRNMFYVTNNVYEKVVLKFDSFFYTALRKVGSLLKSCVRDSKAAIKVDRSKQNESSACILSFTHTLISKSLKNLQSKAAETNNTDACLFTSLESLQKSVHASVTTNMDMDGWSVWTEFLTDLKFGIDVGQGYDGKMERMLYYPTINYGNMLTHFNRLITLLLKFHSCRFHSQLGHIFTTADVSTLRELGFIFNEVLQSVMSVKKDVSVSSVDGVTLPLKLRYTKPASLLTQAVISLLKSLKLAIVFDRSSSSSLSSLHNSAVGSSALSYHVQINYCPKSIKYMKLFAKVFTLAGMDNESSSDDRHVNGSGNNNEEGAIFVTEDQNRRSLSIKMEDTFNSLNTTMNQISPSNDQEVSAAGGNQSMMSVSGEFDESKASNRSSVLGASRIVNISERTIRSSLSKRNNSNNCKKADIQMELQRVIANNDNGELLGETMFLRGEDERDLVPSHINQSCQPLLSSPESASKETEEKFVQQIASTSNVDNQEKRISVNNGNNHYSPGIRDGIREKMGNNSLADQWKLIHSTSERNLVNNIDQITLNTNVEHSLISSRSAFTPVIPKSKFLVPKLEPNFSKIPFYNSIETIHAQPSAATISQNKLKEKETSKRLDAAISQSSDKDFAVISSEARMVSSDFDIRAGHPSQSKPNVNTRMSFNGNSSSKKKTEKSEAAVSSLRHHIQNAVFLYQQDSLTTDEATILNETDNLNDHRYNSSTSQNQFPTQTNKFDL